MSERDHPEMNQDFFEYLPSEIITNILARLPVRTIISCKCVRKSWLDLLESREFVKYHLSNSVPGLAIYHEPERSPALYKVFEFEDMLNLEDHEHQYNLVTKFGFPGASMIRGSANGLLLLSSCTMIRGVANVVLTLSSCKYNPDGLYICNPITRDCIQIHCPFFVDIANRKRIQATFGFGVSKTTGQHKVVKIHREFILDQDTFSWERITDYDCQVYTLGTGSWRTIELDATLVYHCYNTFGVFLNGNLHWLACNSQGVELISYLDLETELFSTFSSPRERKLPSSWRLFAFEDCLCVCDIKIDGDVIVWLMKEYGDGGSWNKEFIISNIPDFAGITGDIVRPIKVLKNGDVLMAWEKHFLFYYSKKTQTSRKIDMIKVCSHGYMDAILHTSSFFSLKSFTTENVISL